MTTAKEAIEALEGNDNKKEIVERLRKSSAGVYEEADAISGLIHEEGNIRKLVEIGDEYAVRVLALMFSHAISGDNGGEVCLATLEERHKDAPALFAKFVSACLEFLKSDYAKREEREETDEEAGFAYEIIYRILNVSRIKTDIRDEARKILESRNRDDFLEKDNESIDALIKGWKRKEE